MISLYFFKRSKQTILSATMMSFFLFAQAIFPIQALAVDVSNKNVNVYKVKSVEESKKTTDFVNVKQNIEIDQKKRAANSTSTKYSDGIVKKESVKNTTGSSTKRGYVQGEILVKYKNTKINLNTVVGRNSAVKFIKNKSLEKKEDLIKNNISVLRIKDTKTVEQKIAELKNDPNIEYVEPNYKRYPSVINSNDTNKGLLWGLDNVGQNVNGIIGTLDADIDAQEAWVISESTTSAPVIVAIIDSGVAYNHPDLFANMWNGISCKDENGNVLGGCNYGYDFEGGDKTPLPTNSSHGTHIAGTIAAIKNNSNGIIGVSPQAKIMALKIGFDVASEVKAIDFAIQNGAKIINASFGASTFSQLEYDAITRFKNVGGIFVTAAGNFTINNEITHLYPSDYNLDNIISVAATDQNDTLATFSNYGVTSVDVGAPGTNIYSTFANTNLLNESFDNLITPSIPSGWTKGGVNSWGTYTLDGGTAWGKVLYGDLAYPYANNTNSTITSPSYNLNGNGAVMDFWTRCDTEYTGYSSGQIAYDYMALEYSSDGVNFTEIYKWDEPFLDWLNDDTDQTGSAVFHFTDMPIESKYLSNNFKFRFRWVTDSSLNSFDGCLVDDVRITKISDGSDQKYDYSDGTSMATPHVAGLAALIEGYNPNLTAAQVKNVILATGDSIASLSGKTVSGKRINAQKALQAVNPAKAITAFTIPGQTGTTTISESDHTVSLTVSFGTVITSLIPTITITGASVSPLSGVAQNFTNPVTYTVTAADGSTQNYIVTVNISINPDIAIAKVVTDQIAALPIVANLMLSDSTIVTNTRIAYDALTPGQKVLVTNVTTLIDAEAQISVLDVVTAAVIELEVAASKDLALEANLIDAKSKVTIANATFKSLVSGGAKTILVNRNNSAVSIVATYIRDADAIAIVDDLIKGINTDLSHITTTLSNPLPASGLHGSKITWISSNTSTVSNDGQIINRPVYEDGDKVITLTANINSGLQIVQNVVCSAGTANTGGGGGASPVCSPSIAESGIYKIFTLTVLKSPAATHTISGMIKYYDGVKVVPNAAVTLENNLGVQIASTTTNASGFYQFNAVAAGSDYVVRVIKNDVLTNGVNVTDLIKIKKHTLGTEILDSMYKKIAGDFNQSGSINVTDLIKIKKYTLGTENPLLKWKFYDFGVTLNPTNYLTTGLSMVITNLTNDLIDQNFVGIKMGDVNNSWIN